jgi:hypothetical protein
MVESRDENPLRTGFRFPEPKEYSRLSPPAEKSTQIPPPTANRPIRGRAATPWFPPWHGSHKRLPTADCVFRGPVSGLFGAVVAGAEYRGGTPGPGPATPPRANP